MPQPPQTRAKPRDAAADLESTVGDILTFLTYHFPNEPLLPGAPDAPATVPPVNVDVPYVEQAGETLSCTMGNWEGEPIQYGYQWKRDGTNVGADAAQHTVTGADVGKSFTCVVTASNAIGDATAPPSNAVVVTAPAVRRT